MNAYRYLNAIYSYIVMIIHDDEKKENNRTENQIKIMNDDLIKKQNSSRYMYSINDIESDGGVLKSKYDIESDGGITKDHIIIPILVNEERLALNF